MERTQQTATPLVYWPRGDSIRRPASWLDAAYLLLTLLAAAAALAAYAVRPVGTPHSCFAHDLANALGEFADVLGLTLFALGLAEMLWVGRKRCPAVIVSGTWVAGVTLAFLLFTGAALPVLNYA